MFDKQAFKFDPNSPEGGQGRWRLRDPKDFSRMWTEKDKNEKGISYIVGTLKDSGKAIQAVRFDRKIWDEKSAGKWWNKVKEQDKYKKLWTEKDWNKWKKKKHKNALLELLVKVANYFDEIEQFHFAREIDQHIKKYADKVWDPEDHNWDEVLIDRDGVKKTRREIRDYYTKNADKLLPYLKDKDVIVLLGVGKNKTILKRNVDGGERIHITKAKGIDDPESIEYYANRRAIEFHPTLGKTTRLIWVDLDPKTDDMRGVAKKITPQVAAVMKKVYPGVKTKVWDSGKRGFHVEGYLDKAVDTDDARHKLREALDEEFADNDDFTTGIAKGEQIRLDTTTLKNTGSIRAPYSFSVYGRPKVPLSNEADDINYADTNVPSFMRLKKIKSPEELLKEYDPKLLIIQEKIDGWKIYAIKEGNTTKLFTRRGKDITANIPDLVDQLNKQLPNDTAILGEVSVLIDGKQSISKAQTLMGSKGPTQVDGEIVYYIYDVLRYKGSDITKKSFTERDTLLRSMLKSSGHIQLLKNYTYDERKNAISNALKNGGEGIVVKVKNAPYEVRTAGETEAYGRQYKFKPEAKSHTEDVFLDSYTLGEPDPKGHRKAVFPAYQYKDGEPFEVGKLSGMDRATEADLKNKIDAGKKIVVEVSYQDRLESGKMRHMGWVRTRENEKPIASVKME